MEQEPHKDNSFRCQYQKGKDYVSVCIRHPEPISAPEIIVALSQLAIKVRELYNEKRGGKVALRVLKIHEDFIKHLENKIGHGSSKSYYLDRKSNKRNNRTERIDLEFIGEYGQNDLKHPLSRYITIYRNNLNLNK